MSSRRSDLLVGSAGAILAGGYAFGVSGHGAGSAATAALLGALLGFSRLRPRATWLAAALLMAATAPLGGAALLPPGGDSFPGYFLVAAHAFSAGRWDGRAAGLGGPVALAAASIGVGAFGHDAAGPFAVIAFAAWGGGRALREREQVAARLAERARELDHEREAHAALSVRYERARIASELHDIVAHAISVMVVQAGAGQRLAGRDSQLTAETFEVIAGAARQAEGDMGRLVQLLGDEAATGPAPDLALVEELITSAAASGLDVTLRLEGERESLSAPVAAAAYRVVQEGLTNALRYASGAAISVLVRGARDELVVEVANGPGGSAALVGVGTGHGVTGLRERVGACGGTVAAGATPEGGWRLGARLPRGIPAASA